MSNISTQPPFSPCAIAPLSPAHPGAFAGTPSRPQTGHPRRTRSSRAGKHWRPRLGCPPWPVPAPRGPAAAGPGAAAECSGPGEGIGRRGQTVADTTCRGRHDQSQRRTFMIAVCLRWAAVRANGCSPWPQAHAAGCNTSCTPTPPPHLLDHYQIAERQQRGLHGSVQRRWPWPPVPRAPPG
jgi:hypothetical protein